MVGAAVGLPVGVQRHEAFSERILSSERHHRPPDGPVLRSKFSGPIEVAIAAGLITPIAQRECETEVETGGFFLAGEIAHHTDRLGRRHPCIALTHPATDPVVLPVGLDTGELAEQIAAVGAPVRHGDRVVLVDQHDGRDVRDRIELGDDMIGVDHHRVGDALGQLTELLDVLVDGDGDDLEVRVPLGMDFLLQCLPPGQLIAATSPTGEGDQQSFLAAMIAQRGDPTAHKVGQGEVGGDEIVECPAASRAGRADRDVFISFSITVIVLSSVVLLLLILLSYWFV